MGQDSGSASRHVYIYGWVSFRVSVNAMVGTTLCWRIRMSMSVGTWFVLRLHPGFELGSNQC